MKKTRTRFAPSPTGYMHIGNLRTALYEYLIAKHDNGDFLLRIEDTDQGRKVEGATDIIYETLKTCGLNWDEGPDIGGEFGPYVQSERLPMYKGYAEELIKLGGAHYCFCEECELERQRKEQGDSFKFIDPCKKLSKEEIQAKLDANTPYVIRQTIDKVETTVYEDKVYGTIEFSTEDLDEQVLIKSDGFPTYNFANIIDDHTMEISHVVRGNEYLSSTPKYNLIYDAYGWERPIYVHCPPVMKDEKHKLSKRNGDASFQDLIAKGYLPEAVINYIALLGWAPEGEEEIFSMDELIQKFDVKRISRNGSIFDIEKLTWMNQQYFLKMDLETFHNLVKPYLEKYIDRDCDLLEVSKVIQQRVKTLNDIEELVDYIDASHPFDAELFRKKKMKTTPENSLEVLKWIRETIEDNEDFSDDEAMMNYYINIAKEHEIKNGRVMFPMTVALTYKASTAGGCVEVGHILGKEETIKRLDASIAQLEEYVKNEE